MIILMRELTFALDILYQEKIEYLENCKMHFLTKP